MMPVLFTMFSLKESTRPNLSALITLLACPIMFRFIENRAIWLRIPERISGIPRSVCKSPVTRPAIRPEARATRQSDPDGCARHQQYSSNCAAGGKASVNSQIGKIQQLEGNEQSKRHNTPDDTLCNISRQTLKKIHRDQVTRKPYTSIYNTNQSITNHTPKRACLNYSALISS